VNSPLLNNFQVLPMSVDLATYVLWSPYIWLSNVAYTVFLSNELGSILLTHVWAGIPAAE
jgi:hypothetical protein